MSSKKRREEDEEEQGQGSGTARKQEGLYPLLLMILRMTKNSPYPFWYGETHAGCGRNRKVDCEGSPLTFGRAARDSGKKEINAAFCDINPVAIEELRKYADVLPSDSLFFCQNNADFLLELTCRIRAKEPNPKFAWGAIFCDPQKYRDFPIKALAEFMFEFRKIDLILNLNATLFQMFQGCKESLNGNVPVKHMDKPTRRELIAMFHKKYWLVRNLVGKGHRFTLCYGTNNDKFFHEGKHFLDFYDINSVEGKMIFDALHNVNPDQLEFPF